MMDGDLQDDPADLPRFMRALEAGADLVVGWRQTRNDSLSKRLQSKIFNAALSLSGLRLHDHNCGFKLVRAEVLRDICLYGDMHRYLPILTHINGYAVTEVQVNHRPRRYGRSNYGLGRTFRGFFDLLTILFLKSYRYRPMHFLGGLGLASLSAGLLGLGYLATMWCFGTPIGNRPLLAYSAVAAMLGAQILATGLLAELLTRNMVRAEEIYAIRADTRSQGAPHRRTLEGATRAPSSAEYFAPGESRV